MSAAPRQAPVPALDDETFAEFQRITLETTGIVLADNKRAMITTRFARRLRALDLPDFRSYLELLASPAHPERGMFFDTVTTNLTYFFREPHHFEALTARVLPAIERRSGGRPVRIWSAGCSHGQEPYSIAIAALESRVPLGRSVRVLCTDIHSRAVGQAREGIYSGEELRGLAPARRDRWFTALPDGRWQASEELRRMLICKELNLFGPWPIRPGVDVVFCRNVLIYFDLEHQRKLVRGFAAIQPPGAHLFLGHSETLRDCDDIYRRVDNTLYERC